MVFHSISSDCKNPKVSRTLLSILADISNTVLWVFPKLSPIYTSPSPLTKLLETVHSAPYMIGITVTFMFHSFCSSQARYKYLSLFSFSFDFHSVVRRYGRFSFFLFFSFFFFLFCLLSLGLVFWPGLCDLFGLWYMHKSGLCIYHKPTLPSPGKL